ncbi:PPC domain-containing DNA-binding protein [Candidimonas nitroreducens]|uniref:Uncharacterized protein n=1 Tax=Candidimonas nitroreducens TaxID=683354 RepID=A0A225N0I4_9BURK|nr:DUF296 domain-containing protein [Candidimonas nitroreducens]OWT66313.1 hypothetical protein CEY11_00810 [Candidimonas nitroreducens]
MSSRILAVDDIEVDCFQLHIAAGQSIWAGVHQALQQAGIHCAQIEFASAWLRASVYHTAPPEASGTTLVKYGAGIDAGAALLLSANATYGYGNGGASLLHCHGLLLAADGRMHGGHLDTSRCIAGTEGLRAQLMATRNSGFELGLDCTSNMRVFHPVRWPEARHGI